LIEHGAAPNGGSARGYPAGSASLIRPVMAQRDRPDLDFYAALPPG